LASLFEPGFARTAKQTGKRIFPDIAGRARSLYKPAYLMVVLMTDETFPDGGSTPK
jgi:hypothetical protein